MKYNSRMRDLLDAPFLVAETPRLPEEIRDVVSGGWIVGPGGSLLLAALWGGGRSSLPASEIGRYEYEVNDVYISLDDLVDDMSRYVQRAAFRGMFFAREMLMRASDLPGSDSLVATVGVHVLTEDEDFFLQGTTVRFFTRRGNYPDWFEDLEMFQREAIAVVELSEILD